MSAVNFRRTIKNRGWTLRWTADSPGKRRPRRKKRRTEGFGETAAEESAEERAEDPWAASFFRRPDRIRRHPGYLRARDAEKAAARARTELIFRIYRGGLPFAAASSQSLRKEGEFTTGLHPKAPSTG